MPATNSAGVGLSRIIGWSRFAARHPLFDDEDPLSVAVPAVSPDVPLPVLNPDAPWVVLKFGGTSVSKRTRWDTIGRLAVRRRGEGARVLLVVSAVSGVTNALQAIIDGHADGDMVRRGADALEARHRQFASELGLDPQDVIGDLWQADVLALGELLSSRFGAAYLQSQGLDLRWSDARKHLRAVALPNQSAWSGRLSVNCDTRSDAAWRANYAAQGDLLITQGFICRDADGRTAILGRGGSDTSAAYFGALLGARAWRSGPTCPACSAPTRARCRRRACCAARLRRGAGNRHHRRQGAASALRSRRAATRACRCGSATPSNPDFAGTVIDAAPAARHPA
jgi:hypothetical protein